MLGKSLALAARKEILWMDNIHTEAGKVKTNLFKFQVTNLNWSKSKQLIKATITKRLAT